METQERKDANRRGASFNKEECDFLAWAMQRISTTENSAYKAEVRIKLHAKFIKMRDSYGI